MKIFISYVKNSWDGLNTCSNFSSTILSFEEKMPVNEKLIRMIEEKIPEFTLLNFVVLEN